MQVARRKVYARLRFYQSVAVYGAVNALLLLMWWFSGSGYPWPLIVLAI